MPRDGSGNYTLPSPPYPFLATTQIVAADVDAVFSDIAGSISIVPLSIGVLAAAGATQGTATPLSKQVNVLKPVASGSGCVLLAVNASPVITVLNRGLFPLLIYPNSGAVIESSAINVAVLLATGGAVTLFQTSTTQWWMS